MGTTATFTLRKNAKRAAEAMIRKGTAPAIDYSIKHSDDGRFEIVWKTARTAPTIGEVETEITEASADQPAASEAEPAPQLVPAATEPATTDAAPQPASKAEAASLRASGRRARPRNERAGVDQRMATGHPRDGAQAQIVA